MQVATKVTIKTLSETTPGELVYVKTTNEGRSLAIILDVPETGMARVGCLAPVIGVSAVPTHIGRAISEPCISFGLDWVLEPLMDASFHLVSKYRDVPGVVHLSESGWAICFAPSHDELSASEIEFDLTTSEITSIATTHAAPVLNWRIWENQETLSRVDAKPLFEMKLEA